MDRTLNPGEESSGDDGDWVDPGNEDDPESLERKHKHNPGKSASKPKTGKPKPKGKRRQDSPGQAKTNKRGMTEAPEGEQPPLTRSRRQAVPKNH